MPGQIRRPQHSFAPDWANADRESAMMGARAKKAREARNARCVASHHATAECDDCRAMAEERRKAAERARRAWATREAQRLLGEWVPPDRHHAQRELDLADAREVARREREREEREARERAASATVSAAFAKLGW